MRRAYGRHGLLAVLGLAGGILSGCATTISQSQPECYPNIFLDSRYAIRGTSLAGAPAPRTGTCYQFGYKDGRMVRVDYLLNGSLSPDPASGVATIRVETSGRAEKRVFFNASGQPAPNRAGIYAVVLTFDDKGQPIEWRNLGADGQLKDATDSGLAMFRWQIDPQGRTIEQSQFGANGQLKIDRRMGVAIIRWQYDVDGNTVEESYFDTDARPALDAIRGVAAIRWQYGPTGRTVEERYLGPDGQLREDKNRGVAMVRWQYDLNANALEERYFGVDQRLTGDRRLGVAIVRWQYDQYGRETERLMFDKNEKRVGAR